MPHTQPLTTGTRAVAARIRTWYAPDIGGVPVRYGFAPSKARTEWEALGTLPPLPPCEGVSLYADLDTRILEVSLYHYQVFPQAMEGLYSLSAVERAPILHWLDYNSPILGPDGIRMLLEIYWGGEGSAEAFCESYDLDPAKYDGPTKEDVDQRIREMECYERRETKPCPDSIHRITSVGYDIYGQGVPWALLADVGSLDEQLLTYAMPDISHNPVDQADFQSLEQLHHAMTDTINGYHAALELLNELQKLTRTWT